MPDNEALIPAEGGKRVTITIAEKSGGSGDDTSGSTTQGSDPNTFVLDNGSMILTITIAE